MSEIINKILRDYAAGKRDFRGVDLSCLEFPENVTINLSGADLSGADLTSINLSNANLSNTNLSGADLTAARLLHVDLSGANLRSANLEYGTLKRVNFSGADLTEVKLDFISLYYVNLDGANLSGCTIPDNRIEYPGLQGIMDAIGYLRRSAWTPIVKQGDSDLRCSKFGGKPWLNITETWPVCPDCHNPMRFFFQLNLQDLPKQVSNQFGQGMFQFFLCLYCEEDWNPFSCRRLVRIIEIDEVPLEFEIPETGDPEWEYIGKEFPSKTITNWQEINTYPAWYSELAELEIIDRINMSEEDSDIICDLDVDLYPEVDQLAGWPNWIQNACYPNCPVCNQEMKQLVFALRSDDNIQFSWGDAGTAYVLQCLKHKKQLACFYQSH